MSRVLSDFEYLSDSIGKIEVTPPEPLISKTVEGFRVLPDDTPFPGLWRNAKTPYLVEPMDWVGPYSGVNEMFHMWGAQVGKTAGLIENPLQYYMRVVPSKILFTTATISLAKKWSGDRLDKLVESCGIKTLMDDQDAQSSGRKSSDTLFEKKFPGGALFINSSGSAAGLRATSFRVVFIDEADGAKAELDTQEGFFADVARARTFAFRGSGIYKIVIVSTPTTYEDSEIYRGYLTGDQCKYLVPCPYCGKKQELHWGGPDTTWGLKPVTEAGIVTDAVYLCEYCRDAIFNHQKNQILSTAAGAEWVPSTQSSAKNVRSTHLSGLYSPVGMFPWVEAWREYERAVATGDVEMRGFTNTVLGLPYQQVGSRPQLADVLELRGFYTSGTVPHGVVFLTCFVDVQRGSKGDKAAKNPERLELEVKGHGEGFRTWSICYKSFVGPVDDPYDGAWKMLVDWLRDDAVFKRDDGAEFPITAGGIDSGDGELTDVVYDFIGSGQVQGFFATKGQKEKAEMKNTRGDYVDKHTSSSRRHYSMSRGHDGTEIMVISTVYYKRHLYRNLKKRRESPNNNPPGYCDFPIDYGDSYFDMLRAERQLADGSFFCPGGRRNEALDCHVGNVALSDLVIWTIKDSIRKQMQARGATQAECRQVTRDHIMQMYQKKRIDRLVK